MLRTKLRQSAEDSDALRLAWKSLYDDLKEARESAEESGGIFVIYGERLGDVIGLLADGSLILVHREIVFPKRREYPELRRRLRLTRNRIYTAIFRLTGHVVGFRNRTR
jgi:hypothetical protein